METNKAIAITASVGFVGLSALAALPGSRYFSTTYRVSFLFLGVLLWTVYGLRERLHLRPIHFALFAMGLLLHDMGVFGAYRENFLSLDFDTYVHFYFGFAAGFILHRSFGLNYGLRGWTLAITVALVTLGIGGLHELIEFASTLLLGPDKGMLKINDPDKFDTQKDLLNNLLGSLAAVLFALAGPPLHSRSTGGGKKREP